MKAQIQTLKENLSQIKVKKMLKNPIIMFAAVVFTTVFAHWILVQGYAYYCAPSGWLGPFKTFLKAPCPLETKQAFLQPSLACGHILKPLKFDDAKYKIAVK